MFIFNKIFEINDELKYVFKSVWLRSKEIRLGSENLTFSIGVYKARAYKKINLRGQKKNPPPLLGAPRRGGAKF